MSTRGKIVDSGTAVVGKSKSTLRAMPPWSGFHEWQSVPGGGSRKSNAVCLTSIAQLVLVVVNTPILVFGSCVEYVWTSRVVFASCGCSGGVYGRTFLLCASRCCRDDRGVHGVVARGMAADSSIFLLAYSWWRVVLDRRVSEGVTGYCWMRILRGHVVLAYGVFCGDGEGS